MSSEVLVAAKKRGPKPKGILKVVYYRRVVPEMVERLDDLLDGKLPVSTAPDPQVTALLNNVGELEAKVADMKDRLERCAMATDDQKAIYWKDRALKAEAVHASRSEFDQT